MQDRGWDEDHHWTSRPGWAAVFASLMNAAISSLRLFPNTEKSCGHEHKKSNGTPKTLSKYTA